MFAPAGLRSQGSPARAPASRPSGRSGTVIGAVFGLLGVLLLSYLGFLIFRSSQRYSPWLDGWLVVGFEMIASALCIAAGFVHKRHRWVAFVMGAGCLSWAAGDLVLTLESLNGATPSVPSLADVFYLGFFPFALVGIMLFTRTAIRPSDTPNWLDGAIAAIGMAAVCSGFAFRGLEHLFNGPSLAATTNLAYPVGDLLLLGLVAGSVVVVTGRSRSTLVLIATGLAVNATGDTFNFAASGSGVGVVLNAIAWPTSLWAIAMAMWVGYGHRSDHSRVDALTGVAVSGFVTIASLAIVVAGSWHHFGPIAIALATLALVLTGFRLAFRPALRLAREQLRSSEKRYRLLFEHNPLPMVAYDRHTLEILDVSDAMVTRYGYSREDLRSMSIRDLVPEQDVELLLSFIARTPDGSRPQYAQTVTGYPRHHRLKDGTLIDIEVTSNNIDLDGRECRIAHFEDVTERNRVSAELAAARDQAVEASNMKSAFLANVSHEIRTPMNGVIGMTELLLDMGLTPAQREYAEQVARSGEQMLSIINDILDLSKIETGHLELDLGDFDLDEAIKEICSAASALARAKGLRLDVTIDPAVPRRVRGDRRRLQQVVLNLVSNAVKFTSVGTVGVRVRAASKSQEPARVRIEVSDTGIGIDPAGLRMMFEPFTQADVSTTRLYGGTGLGLAIARELVELMGGTIGAESEPGRGSTFFFDVELGVPLAADAPAPSAAEPAAAAAAAAGWASSPLVLVAEDSQINQIVAVRALERCGCRTHVVRNGLEAIEALAAQRYDAVLMDCQMPDMDGYDATAELRRREGADRRTPVIAMTAHAMDGDRQRCLDAGMDDYLTKPMRFNELSAVLSRWIAVEPSSSIVVTGSQAPVSNAS